MEHIASAMELKAELDKLRPIDKEQEEIIMQKFRLDWDYHSNHLEGNSLTYGETKALILFGITAQGKPLKDHFEITGHDEAIKWVTEIVKGDYPLTEQFIRELHVLLLKEPYERPAETPDGQKTTKRIEVGKYKSTPNHVRTKTGEIFRFATPEETPALMQDLVEWYREKWKTPDVNPVILAAEFHYRFIRIHPFDDGNGRIARILMNFILMQFGYPPVIIKTEDKGNYFSALQLADAGNIEPFVEYIGKNLVRSLELMIAGAKGESIEEPDDLDKEIALLERKVYSAGRKVNKAKSKEAILDIYDTDIERLYTLFESACKKFDRFYMKSLFYIEVNNGPGRWWNSKGDDNPKQKARDRITNDTRYIKLNYEYEVLNIKGLPDENYSSDIYFKFQLDKYIVSFSEYDFEKLYDSELSSEELNLIIKKISEEHKGFIVKKLKKAKKLR